MKGCSVNGERYLIYVRIFTEIATQVKSYSIFTKIAEMLWKRVGQLPRGHSISIVPSQEMCTLCFGSHMC